MCEGKGVRKMFRIGEIRWEKGYICLVSFLAIIAIYIIHVF